MLSVLWQTASSAFIGLKQGLCVVSPQACSWQTLSHPYSTSHVTHITTERDSNAERFWILNNDGRGAQESQTHFQRYWFRPQIIAYVQFICVPLRYRLFKCLSDINRKSPRGSPTADTSYYSGIMKGESTGIRVMDDTGRNAIALRVNERWPGMMVYFNWWTQIFLTCRIRVDRNWNLTNWLWFSTGSTFRKNQYAW